MTRTGTAWPGIPEFLGSSGHAYQSASGAMFGFNPNYEAGRRAALVSALTDVDLSGLRVTLPGFARFLTVHDGDRSIVLTIRERDTIDQTRQQLTKQLQDFCRQETV